MLICIDGPDKVGKHTQTEILSARLDVPMFSYPNYESDTGKQILKMLAKKIPHDATRMQQVQMENKLSHLPILKDALKEYRHVIVDRYLPSAIVYGTADYIPLEYLLKLNHILPVPDLTIIIDRSPLLIEDDANGIPEFQQKVRDAYKFYAKPFGWHVIDGSGAIEEVASRIWELVDVWICRDEFSLDKIYKCTSDDDVQEQLQDRADPNTEN